jgi:predicted MFS family arabinose efflux permease
VYNVSASAVLQTGVPDEVIGRVSATVGSAASLALPIGLLVGGVAGEWVGSRTVLYASGLGTALTALYWFVVPSLREFGPPTAVESGTFARV